MPDINWPKLFRDFRENRCVLLLGPRLAMTGSNGQAGLLQEKLAERIADLLEVQGQPLDVADRRNLAYVTQRYVHSKQDRLVDLWDKVEDFYREHAGEALPLYQKLAALPVSVAVNTTPDTLLGDAFREQGKEPWLRHYNFRRNKPFDLNTDLISTQKPLVYNLLGWVSDKESLVLTPNDHMEFIRKVLEKNPRVPDELVSQFSPFSTYIFLGFDWENWYLRLLIDGLNLCQNTAFAPQADNYPISPATRAFYEDRFNFHFIDDQRTGEFTDRILAGLTETGTGTLKQKKLVILSASEDTEFLRGLEQAMLPMERNGEVTLFHHDRVLPGQDEVREMRAQIAEADVVLLLLSSDFLANDRLLDNELEWAKEKLAANPNALIPVVARACDWKADRDLRKITPLPDDGLPIATGTDRDEAFQRIVNQLKRRLT
ncbi:MAG TPA: SIR2 family protein [Saprospiraceae bacterium]|nr:SIR2 family protein [Saprospiraceae bacterium]